MRRVLLAAAALLAAAVYAALPPQPLPLPPTRLDAAVRGAVHVHTRRSDGSGTPEQVARAASEAGLRFVILTDHGDGTRIPDGPAYYGGVLVIDAVEISTDGGHLVALGLPQTPYPLGGEARDVLEDVHRMGGMAIAAHPSSPKAELRWPDWDLAIDGLEHLNGDTEWRDENVLTLTRALIAYPFRPAATMASLFDRAAAVFARWDAATRSRRIVALAGADAHGRLALRGDDPYRGRVALPVPGYVAVFRSASIGLPGLRLSGDAAADAAAVLDAIRAGHVFSSVDALASHPSFQLTARSGAFQAAGGDVLPLNGPLHVEAAVQAPPAASIVLLRDGVEVHNAAPPALHYALDPPQPGTYRAEVRLPGAPGSPAVPWLVSNPIYAGRPVVAPAEQGEARPRARTDVYLDGPATTWTVEHAPASRAAIDVVKAREGTQILMRYAISGAASSHPFAALVTAAGPIAGHDRVTFVAQADRPMRLSVQLRAESATAEGERWHRSVFVDAAPREVTVRFDDMRRRGPARTPRPRLDAVRWLLFVVDTVNTPPGTAGRLTLDEIRYER